ncbi:hypothetical protein [Methyloparacoccus murrellii]
MLKKTASLAVLPLTLMLGTPSVHAFSGQGTVTVDGGKTTLDLAPAFFNIFPALRASLGQYNPARLQGTLNNQNLRITFPLATGTLNPNRPQPEVGFYNLLHRGGLAMNNPGTNASIILNAPNLHTGRACFAASPCLEMGGTLIVNGTVFGSIPNFAQNIGAITTFPLQNGTVRIDNMPLFLTASGASLMNQFFGLVEGGQLYLREGAPFGTVHVKGTGARVICPPNTEYSASQQRCR